MQRRNKLYEREMKCALRELPYFNIRGDISIYHGRFNNSLICNKKSRRSLESLPSLNDLFSLNSEANNSLNTDSDSFSFINSRYYSPYSFQKIKSSSNEHDLSIFHSNIRSIRLNLENLENEILGELAAAKFLSLLQSFGLVQHVTVPTHVAGHTLDLVITREDCDLSGERSRPPFVPGVYFTTGRYYQKTWSGLPHVC